MSLAVGVLIASLLGSVHCAGMCGGFVCFYTGGAGSGPKSHVAYNAGRLVSYLMLGVFAGVVGASVDRAGALTGISRVAAFVSGTLMVAWGLSTLLATGGVRVPGLGLPFLRGSRNPLGALLARMRDRSPLVRSAATGLLTTLLPCGWLYAFVASAAGTGSIERATLVMTFFWLGTLPMMLTAGYGLQRLTGALRPRLPLVTATAVIVMGFLSMAGKMRVAPEPLERATVPTPHLTTRAHEHR
jgi:uncharacterized protein